MTERSGIWTPSMVGRAMNLGLVREGEEIILGGPSISASELDDMSAMVVKLQDLIASLVNPSGTDLQSFVHGLGYTREEAAALTWSGADDWRHAYCRADIVRTDGGIKILELNVGGCVGGMVDAALPNLTGLSQTDDSLTAWARHVVDAGGGAGRGVLVEDGHLPSPWRRYVGVLADALASCGSPGFELRRSFDLGWDGESLTDAIGRIAWLYPVFFASHVCEFPHAYSAIGAAAASGRLTMPVSFGATVFGSKLALARLWDLVLSGSLVDEDVRFIRNVVPETVVLTGSNTHSIAKDRADLVLKPAVGFGGSGVVVGREVDDDTWRREIEDRLSRPERVTVVQEFVDSRTEEAITLRPGGEVTSYRARFIWGVFIAGGKRCGSPLLRCKSNLSTAVINFATGAAIGPCPPLAEFHGASD